MTNDQPVIRRADAADAEAVAEVWLRSYDAALPTVRRPRPDDQVRTWFVEKIVPTRETWVAVADGAVVGMMVLHDGDLDQLYLAPEWRGRGIGDRLVEVAKERCPEGLELWTFQVNTPAQRFYERHGFVESRRTDGSANEEREPDVRYVWKP
ncbi:GNAT family N-acetyltransferase [Kitasatospora sp. NPDC048722]|uniref:GNAT family N-acetyltransferase n=1 Tax=Kitasatospora sp. NPDC048722 TaxID=3155639 RepID=UPI0033EDF88B